MGAYFDWRTSLLLPIAICIPSFIGKNSYLLCIMKIKKILKFANILKTTRTKTSIDTKKEGKKLNFWWKRDQRCILRLAANLFCTKTTFDM